MSQSKRSSSKPRRANKRIARRRALYLERVAQACTPSRRVSAASDYLRAVLPAVQQQRAQQIADEVTSQLLAVADRLESELLTQTKGRGDS